MSALVGQASARIYQPHGRQAVVGLPRGSGSLTAIASASETQTGESVRPLQTANALLPVLPAPLELRHGPLLVTLHWWADGSVVADLPACALYGSGTTDTAALEDLANVMADWARGVRSLGDENLRGALKRQWIAFKAFVDTSAL